MAQALTLAIDQGTHASKVFVFDANGVVLAQARRDIKLHRPGPLQAEQDPIEILASVRDLIAEVFADSTVDVGAIQSAGMATQRSSVVAWDRHNGQVLSPVLSWQDRRAETLIANWQVHAAMIREHTGLQLSPHFGASKIRWLLDSNAEVRRAHQDGRLAIGPLAAYLVSQLLAENPLLVDHANAARTMLCHLQTRDWDPQLLQQFGIDADLLPQCRPVCSDYGVLAGTTVSLLAVQGDQTAAVYGYGEIPENIAVINIGTGAFVLAPTGRSATQVPDLLSSVMNSDAGGGEYAIEGTINGAGSALEWAGKRWPLPTDLSQLDGVLASMEDPPIFINSIGGLGSPWWRPGEQPRFSVQGELMPEQAWVAVIESIVFLIQANLDAMLAAGTVLDSIRVSGGLSRLDGICQRLSDLSGLVVHRPDSIEATARGVAWLAAGRPESWKLAGGDQFVPTANSALSKRYQWFMESFASDCTI